MNEKKFSKLLIKAVKKYPCLYNAKSKDYRNRTLTKSVWEKIAEHLDNDGKFYL